MRPAVRGGTTLIMRRTAPKPTPVFDTFWRFACERQAVYLRRVRGQRGPWTSDPIIAAYRFTNPFRAADRVSQFLIRHVIYASESDARDTICRVLLFKLFNKVETWSLLEAALGRITSFGFSVDRADHVLSAAMNGGTSIYSGAYIMPSGPESIRREKKHRMHLELLSSILRGGLAGRLAKATTMKAVYEGLREVPSFGPFLAYQFAIDLNYSPLFDHSEMEFVVPGPGARDGLRKCFSSLGDYSESDTIRWVTEQQDDQPAGRGLKSPSLWGRRLQLVDVQNLFCEIDKYARVAHPDYSGHSGRTRIKQKFAPKGQVPPPWFPPKWGINHRVADDLIATSHASAKSKRAGACVENEPATAIAL